MSSDATEIVPPTVVAFAPRERVRAMLRVVFPRRRARVVLARSAADFATAFKQELVDAAIVDLGSGHADTATVSALARDFPGSPFFGISAMLGGDGPSVALAAELEFADVLVEGVDDSAVRELVARQGFSARFSAALRVPPDALALGAGVQVNAWQYIVAHAGRRVQTGALARHLGVTREHLSRTFAADGAPNLKRVIDLVRLLAAAELANVSSLDSTDEQITKRNGADQVTEKRDKNDGRH